jgi:hypothetical protein
MPRPWPSGGKLPDTAPLKASRHATPAEDARCDPISIRFGHPQHLLRNERQDQLDGNRSNARQHGLAEVTFYMEFAGITHAAVGQDCGFGGAPTGFCAEELGGICLRAARPPLVVEPGGAPNWLQMSPTAAQIACCSAVRSKFTVGSDATGWTMSLVGCAGILDHLAPFQTFGRDERAKVRRRRRDHLAALRQQFGLGFG